MSGEDSGDGVLGPFYSGIDFPFSFCADVLCIPYDAYRHYDYRHSETFKLDREATAYIQDAVPKIVTNWNSQELVDRATTELLAGEPRDKIDRLFVKFQRLGTFKHLDKPEGIVEGWTYTGMGGTVTRGNYTAKAEFEKGNATIKIQLRRVGDTWKISGFHINSDALLSPKA